MSSGLTCSDHEEECHVNVTCPRTRLRYGSAPGKKFFVPPSFLLENVLLCPVIRAVVFLISGVLEVVGFSKSFHKSCSEITVFFF